MVQEIEILVPVNTTKEAALHALSKYGTPALRNITDTYFTHASIPFLDVTGLSNLYGSLRIRDENGKHILTVKHDKFDGDRWLYSDEHELVVENSDAARELLVALGFTALVDLRTERHAYHSGAFEIVLDDVEGLGLFLEVEAKTHDGDAPRTKEKVRAFLRSLPLPLGEELNIGKFELALQRKAR